MNRVTLSQVIGAMHDDDDLKKLAESTSTESPVAEQVGTSTEDQKAKIQTKLMELAGQETAARSDAVAVPLNVIANPPAGEKVTPQAVKVSDGAEMSEVVASAMEKLDPEQRKIAATGIIEKIAAMNVFTTSEADALKTAGDKFKEDEVRGRIQARGFHDEINKLAELDRKALEKAAEEAAKAEKAAADKKAETEKAAAAGGKDDVDKLLEELGVKA